MSYTHINPAYVAPGQEAEAEAFDSVLGELLPAWAAEMSEGYAWSAPIPPAAEQMEEAAALAAHLQRERQD